MNIQEEIQRFIEENEILIEPTKTINHPPINSKVKLEEFVEKVRASNYNFVLAHKFAKQLQLSNDPPSYAQYDLEDIRKLYDFLTTTLKFDLHSYVEGAYFEWSVMDDEKRAINLIEKGLENAKIMINKLEKIKTRVSNN